MSENSKAYAAATSESGGSAAASGDCCGRFENCECVENATLPCGHPASDETSADGYTFCAVCAVTPVIPRARDWLSFASPREPGWALIRDLAAENDRLYHALETERDAALEAARTIKQEAFQREIDWAGEHERLRKALEQIAGDRCCQIIYGNREHGWTCLDEQYQALVQPQSYSQELGDALRSGAKRCAVCIARVALGLGGRDAT